MLKIFGHPLSSPSNKVLYCANALNLDYQQISVDLTGGEQHSAEHLARHPFGKVPVIDDDGFLLFESGAILCYLARREKSALYPSTYRQRARVDQWSHFSSIMLNLPMQKIFLQRILVPMLGAPPNETMLNEGITQVDAYLPVYEKHLSGSKFMCGDAVSLADITLLAVLDCAEAIKLDLSIYPALVQWRTDLMTREFYTRVHRYYGEGLLDT